MPTTAQQQPLKTAPNWSLYLIRTRTDTLYAGITTDVAQRLKAHSEGKQGAKYLRSKGPLTLVYQVELGSRSLASKAEYWIKKLTKAKKEKIVVSQPDKTALLTLLKIEQ
ncbi:MAG: GIY-YIG nuclease family protein [Phormidesmis sp.]